MTDKKDVTGLDKGSGADQAQQPPRSTAVPSGRPGAFRVRQGSPASTDDDSSATPSISVESTRSSETLFIPNAKLVKDKEDGSTVGKGESTVPMVYAEHCDDEPSSRVVNALLSIPSKKSRKSRLFHCAVIFFLLILIGLLSAILISAARAKSLSSASAAFVSGPTPLPQEHHNAFDFETKSSTSHRKGGKHNLRGSH